MKLIILAALVLILTVAVVGCDDWQETRRSRLRGDIDNNLDRIELLEERIDRLETLLLEQR